MDSQRRTYPHVYDASQYGAPIYGIQPYQLAPLDVNWQYAWPKVRSLLLGITLLISSAAIIGLDIANVAIEAHKQNGTSTLGMGTAQVGAGVWGGAVSFFAAIFILIIIFVKNKRIAATFALISVVLTFLFMIVVVGLIGNSVQNNQSTIIQAHTNTTQRGLLISILSTATFIIFLCILYFIMYISVFFSPSTRQPISY